jgi:thiol-disulfide isomerase/thioredoxin
MNEKKKSDWKGNLFFLALIGIILFTPIGFQIRVWIAKLIQFNPSVESIKDRKRISHFNWDLSTPNNQMINFSQSKGKVVLLNFWATWCPPCVAELPDLQNLYSHYEDNPDIDFYFVTQEETKKVKDFLSKKDYSIPFYSAYSGIPKELESSSIPTTFLINKKGEIVINKTGAADWDDEEIIRLIDDILKE